MRPNILQFPGGFAAVFAHAVWSCFCSCPGAVEWINTCWKLQWLHLYYMPQCKQFCHDVVVRVVWVCWMVFHYFHGSIKKVTKLCVCVCVCGERERELSWGSHWPVSWPEVCCVRVCVCLCGTSQWCDGESDHQPVFPSGVQAFAHCPLEVTAGSAGILGVVMHLFCFRVFLHLTFPPPSLFSWAHILWSVCHANINN